MKRFLPLLLVTCGCALTRPHVVEVSTGTNGTVTRKEIWLPAFAVWPASQTLEKQRGSIGKTLTAGFSEASQDGGSTNIADTIKALTDLLKTLKSP